ncbi:MAG TPA: virulence factor [Dongiaceae bacterium]|jgi:hypothetical protein|nr:virulence factor [Dongiaceae bacterium]
MAELIVVYWRDIPAQLIVKKGRLSEKAPLDERFEKAIDRAAMRAGFTGTDAYLAEWRKGTPLPVGDDLVAELAHHKQRLEREFDEERLKRLVLNGGKEPDQPGGKPDV